MKKTIILFNSLLHPVLLFILISALIAGCSAKTAAPESLYHDQTPVPGYPHLKTAPVSASAGTYVTQSPGSLPSVVSSSPQSPGLPPSTISSAARPARTSPTTGALPAQSPRSLTSAVPSTPPSPKVTTSAVPSTGPSSIPPSLSAPPAGLVSAKVRRVIDGDTIEVYLDGKLFKVRYIGIDAPETGGSSGGKEPYSQEATDGNKALVDGKTVSLEKDVSEVDQFGRLLRYVYVGGLMVNAELVRAGFARAVAYPPDVKYQNLLLQMQNEAAAAGRGLWGPAPVRPRVILMP